MESLLGHPWQFSPIEGEVLLVRFHHGEYALDSNSGKMFRGWLHAMPLGTFDGMSKKEKWEFSENFGKYVSIISVSYAEVVGVHGTDVAFSPAHVLSVEFLEMAPSWPY